MEAQLLDPVYALVGDEPVARRAALARLSARCVHTERVSAAATSPEQIWSGSLLADPDHPVAKIVSDYPKWTTAQRKRFVAIARAPTPGLTVVMLCQRLGPKDPLREVVDDKHIIECEPPKPGAFERWAVAQARAIGLQTSSAAIRELVRRTGERTTAILSELERLAPLGDLTEDSVLALVDDARSVPGWGWVDAVVDGDLRRAMTELALIEERGDTTPIAAVGALQSRVTMIAWVHAGVAADNVSAKPYPWTLASQAARGRWDRQRTSRGLATLGLTDAGLRGASRLPEWTQMAMVTASMCLPDF